MLEKIYDQHNAASALSARYFQIIDVIIEKTDAEKDWEGLDHSQRVLVFKAIKNESKNRPPTHKEIANLSKEDLLKVLDMYAKNWLAMDGV